jgi:hypothetical protein
MARGEDEPQEVVADLVGTRVIQGIHEIRHDQRLPGLEVTSDLLQLPSQRFVAAQAVQRAVPGRGHQPSPGILRHAFDRPVFQRGNQRILRELFRHPYVAHHPCDAGDYLGGFDAPDRVDGVVRARLHVLVMPGLTRACALSLAEAQPRPRPGPSEG